MRTRFFLCLLAYLPYSGLSAQCNCAWMASQDTVGCGIIFNDLSTGNPNTWYWSFGDAQTSTLQNPYHNYPAPGTYNVCLVITNTSTLCVDTTCGNINVICFPTGVQYFHGKPANEPNYPNPFTDVTFIPYHLPLGTEGKVIIYDLHGRIVAQTDMSPGNNIEEIKTEGWDSGYYIYIIEINGACTLSGKMVLVK